MFFPKPEQKESDLYDVGSSESVSCDMSESVTPKHQLASDGKKEIKIELRLNGPISDPMPFSIAVEELKKPEESNNMQVIPKKFPDTQSLGSLPDDTRAVKPKQHKNIVKKTNINLQLVKSLSYTKSEELKGEMTGSTRKHIILKRATQNSTRISNKKLSARDELKTPPKQISQRSKVPSTLIEEQPKLDYDPKKSLSPQVLNQNRSSIKATNPLV